jgi:hypothetical protein
VVDLDGSDIYTNKCNSRKNTILLGIIMRITKIAADASTNERKLDKLEREIATLRREYKKSDKDSSTEIKVLKQELKEVNKTLKALNIGKRLFYQNKTVFTTLQRKIEKLEAVESEWKKFKETVDDKVKKMISKQNRARVQI